MVLNKLVIDSRYWCNYCNLPIEDNNWIQTGKSKYGKKFGNQGIGTYHKSCLARKESLFYYTVRGKKYKRHYGNFSMKRCKFCNKLFKPTSGVQKVCKIHRGIILTNP